MADSRMPGLGVGFAASFTVVGVVVITLLMTRTISFELAMLMLVASVAMHLGFGILVAVYRLIGRLH